MRLSEGNPFKTCANPQACDQKLSRANRYENKMVLTYLDLNCWGASASSIFGPYPLGKGFRHASEDLREGTVPVPVSAPKNGSSGFCFAFSVNVRRGRQEGDGTENVMTERPSHARWFCP